MMRGLIMMLFLTCWGLSSDSSAQMQVEHLNRGGIAVFQQEGCFLSWRLLADEPYDTGFNIYRDGQLLNDEPLTATTNYLDADGRVGSTYALKKVINGRELKEAEASFKYIEQTEGAHAGYFDIPLKRPAKGVNGGEYSPNDGSAGDLNGDGTYELVLMWSPNNAKDNSHRGVSDQVILDAYTLDGEHLWRIELGPNIRSGAHYTQFLVYDFNGDGKSEMMVKTAPGTRYGTGALLSKGPAATADHSVNYTNSTGYIIEGPEYVTVFDGATGKELATADYWPQRGRVRNWGDSYGNRMDRFNATVAYVDGERPSAIFQRGYYTRLTMAAWDWRDGELTQRWTFDSDTRGNEAYAGQGNHSIHVIDANNDGRHDIVTGPAIIASDGTGMHTTGMGHGDATHVTYMLKDFPYPQIAMPHESGGHGFSLRHAHNGEILFNHRNPNDVGRGVGAEIDPEVPGFHFWGTHGMGLYNMTGEKVGDVPRSMNFVVWWDGDLSRELLSGNRIDKWSIANNSAKPLLNAEGARSINGTKATPVLQADLLGDWREEVVLRREDNEALRVYTTTMPTAHRLYTLMHDPVYRVAVSWQNSSYNQPPHPGYYIATDMDFPPPTPRVKVLSGKE
ncbi:rhamnogalacturonan lyase [Geofilum rubicundum]|uniref:Predicted rhamnogalacturonan lyase in rhamnose utilization cluster n=1 Tax=Geofilum rubicundum JCM 15548 TaxID=1236989 RepID=A0A0E9LX75_9BACT|nr:rhamnogalacturonan lyase [Geofilum rubicundum]GAO29455.1 predicted rhamnogalacturonan lyase in rhamnose utilization cluster [Geofilum rubicundum JCM 15548]